MRQEKGLEKLDKLLKKKYLGKWRLQTMMEMIQQLNVQKGGNGCPVDAYHVPLYCSDTNPCYSEGKKECVRKSERKTYLELPIPS